MTREEAIYNLSVALGECGDVIKRQAEQIKGMAEDMNRLNDAFGKVKELARRTPIPFRKSYISPYAKFDKLKKK